MSSSKLSLLLCNNDKSSSYWTNGIKNEELCRRYIWFLWKIKKAVNYFNGCIPIERKKETKDGEEEIKWPERKVLRAKK